jgi:hypothetical protein
LTSKCSILWHWHYVNSTGVLCTCASTSNCVHWCTLYTQDSVRRTFLVQTTPPPTIQHESGCVRWILRYTRNPDATAHSVGTLFHLNFMIPDRNQFRK